MAKKLTYTQELQIDVILDQFDFGKVAKVMEDLDWCWFGSLLSPEPRALRKEAERLLQRVCLETVREVSCGGLMVKRFTDGALRLAFILEEKDA